VGLERGFANPGYPKGCDAVEAGAICAAEMCLDQSLTRHGTREAENVTCFGRNKKGIGLKGDTGHCKAQQYLTLNDAA